MDINVIAQSRSETAYAKNLSKITNQEEFDEFFKESNLSSIPYIKVTCNKFQSLYLNVGFLSLLSGNHFVLDKFLTQFPDILDEKLIIESSQEKMKDYSFKDENFQLQKDKYLEFTVYDFISWDNLDDKISSKLEDLLRKNLFSEKILFSLYRKNLIDSHLLTYIDKITTEYLNKKRFYYANLVDFYFENKLHINNSEIFYKEFYLNNKEHTKESYLKTKERFSFFTNKKEEAFFEDKNIFWGFSNNFNSFYFEEFFKKNNIKSYREGYDKQGIFVKNIKNDSFKHFGSYDSHNLTTFFKNNHSISLFKSLEQFFTKENNLFNNVDIKETLDNSFSIEKDDFSEFYLLLNQKYNYYLKPDLVNANNLESLKTVIENNKKEIQGNDLKNIIYKKCKSYNYDFIKNIIGFNNTDRKSILEEFLKNAITLNRKLDSQYAKEITDYIIDNNNVLNIDLNMIDFKSKVRNEISSLIEKTILNSFITKHPDNNIKKIKRL